MDPIPRFPKCRIAVIGDVMLDHFLIGQVERISPEAPVPVVRFAREDYRLGGAANVAHNIAALGGQAILLGLIGQDEAAAELGRQLQAAGVDAASLVSDAARPTTRKVRVVTSRNQQVARVDYESDADIGGDPLADLSTRVRSLNGRVDAIVLSDYRKGVVTDEVIAAAEQTARSARVPLLIDPKVPQVDRYRGATLITPNQHEAELMAQQLIRTDEDARAAARTLADRTGGSVLITRGEHGMWVLDRSGGGQIEERLAAATREVADVTGAGDTVIAVLALGLAAGASLVDAAQLANRAAGLVVARFGPATVTADELRAASSG